MDNTAAVGQRRVIIPTYALTGARDRIVKEISSTLNIPVENVFPPLNAGHGSLKSPALPTHYAVKKVSERMQAIAETRLDIGRGRTRSKIPKRTGAAAVAPIPVVISRFRGAGYSDKFLKAYLDACSAQEFALPIVDGDVADSHIIAVAEVRITATDVGDLPSKADLERDKVDWVVDCVAARKINSGGVALVGLDSDEFVEPVKDRWVPAELRYEKLWVEGATDIGDLRSLIGRWLSSATASASLRTRPMLGSAADFDYGYGGLTK